MVAGIQYFKFERRLLFESRTKRCREPKLDSVVYGGTKERVVTHRNHTTDLVR